MENSLELAPFSIRRHVVSMENSLELAPFFKSGRLIIVHGGSHPALDDAMDASPTFKDAILAFARKGDGYLAITAEEGFSLIKHGHSAFRELRSYGKHNIWLCHLGRLASDGDFSTFQENILTLDVKFGADSVQCPTLRGEMLAFGWQGPFFRDGREQPLSGFGHYEHPHVVSEYPSRQLDIRHDESILRLNFGNTSNF